MAISTSVCGIRYGGNGSTVTPYSIPFPFLATADIYAAVSSDGEVAAVLLDPGDYAVTRLADGSGGSLVTAEEIDSPAEIVIFRRTPLTQPTTFQLAGPFPAPTVATALDRLEMQIQELTQRHNVLAGVPDDTYVDIPGDTQNTDPGHAIWANPAARAAVVPRRVGQFGIEISTQSAWIAQSTTAGDWEEFPRRFTNKVTIGLVADAGDPSAYQTAAATALADWDPDAVIFAGDNNYNAAAGYTADWAAFVAYINAGIAYPALGNHDLDTVGYAALHAAKFPYLPGNKRYYNVVLGDGLVELFVLNSGRNSLWDLVEADGNTVGSVQHQWFVAALAVSKARWKIAVFHIPPASLSDNPTNEIEPNMAWPQLAQMDLICCGHTHLLEILKWSDTALVNLSAIARAEGRIAATIQGGESTDYPLWADAEPVGVPSADGRRGLGRIIASQDKLTIEAWELQLPYGGRRILHSRDARDFSRPEPYRETFTPIAADDTIGSSEVIHLTTMATNAVLLKADVVILDPTPSSSNVQWTVYAGMALMADGEIDMIDSTGASDGLLPDEIIPKGTEITIELNQVDLGGLNAGFEITLTFLRLN